MKRYLLLVAVVVILVGTAVLIVLRLGGLSSEDRAEIRTMAEKIRTEYPREKYPHFYERMNTRNIHPDYHQQFSTVEAKQNDYKVRVSWPEPLTITDHGDGHVVRVQNELDEKTLLLWKPFKGSLWKDLTERLEDNEASSIQKYLGDYVTSSNYSLRKAWLDVTIEDIEHAKSVEEAEAIFYLMLLMLEYDDPYAFDLGHIRGFVFHPSHIEIYAVGDDNALYQISGHLDPKETDIIISSFQLL